jgi:copper homeostasis protein CutC|tara:strand:- start:114 stop:314 length:201 start_codon:yes stop_codon:yes gene_type:complete
MIVNKVTESVMIRPRPGDFVYTTDEQKEMLRQIVIAAKEATVFGKTNSMTTFESVSSLAEAAKATS